MTEELLRTPLYDMHVALGGRMVGFAGWCLPVCFAGVVAEHRHTRDACSVFDVSHMGRLRLGGRDAGTLLDLLCTRRLADAEPGRSYYTHICREDGGILDDVIVSRFEEDWGVVCNAANREKIVKWITRHAAGRDASLTDETDATAMVAIQGPTAVDLARTLAGLDLSTLRRYGFMERAYMGLRVVVYRSGYTGEDGLEVVAPAGAARLLLEGLFGPGFSRAPDVRPAGLGARDTLRIEAGMPLYGHELSESVDSLSAGQGWCVDLEREFIGAASLRRVKAEGLRRRLVGLQLDGRRTARQHHAVLAAGREVGTVTSGVLSPTLDRSIAMAYVPPEHAEPGTTLEVAVGRKRAAAVVVALPFYKRPKK
ncbi:MAG: glycine cleavage system aminomethyltransferase GcvT [Phycisphaerae bacterium]